MSRPKNGHGKHVNYYLLLVYSMVLLFAVSMFFILLLLLFYIFAPQLFTNNFGYQLLLMIPMLTFIGRLLFYDKKDLIAIGVAVFTFFMILLIGGVFSDNPPSNNISTLVSVILYIALLGVMLKKSKGGTETTNPILSPMMQMRNKYLKIFGFLSLVLMLLYFWNPGDIMTTYFGPTMFFSLFIGIFLLAIIFMYNSLIGDVHESQNDFAPEFMKKMVFALVGLGFAGLLIWGALKMFGILDFDSDCSPSSSISILLNFALLFVVMSFVYRYFNLSRWMEKNPVWSLLVNIVFYIPCLFTYLVMTLTGQMDKKSPTEYFKSPAELKYLLGSILLLAGYVFLPWFYKKYLKNIQYKKLDPNLGINADTSFLQSIFHKYQFGVSKNNIGKLLTETPVPTNILTNVTSFPYLSETETFDRQFALSFWFYLDSFAPSTSSAYSKVVSLLSYGDNPAVSYSSELNTLFVTSKHTEIPEEAKGSSLDADKIKMYQKEKKNRKQTQNTVNEIEGAKLLAFGTELDSNGNRILYKHSGVLLQKWNHMLFNMSGGTLDIFVNGKLMKTSIGVVPYVKNDLLTIGCEGGVHGHVAGLTYFEHPLDYNTINDIYVEFKDKKVPFIVV